MLENHCAEHVPEGHHSQAYLVPPRLAPLSASGPERVTGSSRDSLSFRLLLALNAGYRAPGRAADLGDDAFLLVFRQVLHEKVVSPLQFGIAIDLFQDTFPDALLAIQFAHFAQHDSAFQALPRHGLDVAPVLRVLFDVRINLCVHFWIVPEGRRVVGSGIAAGARWRGWFYFTHTICLLFRCAAFAVFAEARR